MKTGQSSRPASGLATSRPLLGGERAAPFRRREQPCRGLTLLELLVVLAVIGLVGGLLLPAVQIAREAARRVECQSNLHQLGLALHAYHAAHRSFPPGGIEPRPIWKRGRQYAWSAMILPYLQHSRLADQIDFARPFDDEKNRQAAAAVIDVYLCPTTPRSEPRHEGRGACDYGGIYGERITGPNRPPKGVMLYDRVVRFRDILDGTARTLLVAEDSTFPDGQWINGRNVFDQAFAINQAPRFENDIRSLHPQGAFGLFCDGSTQFLSDTIDLHVLAAVCTRAGREAVSRP